MSVAELCAEALSSVRAGGMRSFLSVLGIVIGVAAVITLVSLGQGAQVRVTSQLTQLGTNLVTVTPAFQVGSGGRVSAEPTQPLTIELAHDLLQGVPAVSAVTPLVQGRATLVVGSSNLSSPVVGVAPSYGSILNYRALVGRFIQPRDARERRVAVALGYQVAAQLFGGRPPVGESITLVFAGRAVVGTVVGVMEPKGALFFSNFDEQVYVPVETLVERGIARNRVGSYLVQVRPDVPVEEAVAQLEFWFGRRLGETGLVNIASQQALLSAVEQATGTMTLLLAAIAGVALVVGGIGIMNVMLVAVAERTREIGIRMAMGARRRDISRQFLAEAAALSLIGGAVGLGAGWAAAWALARSLGFPFIMSAQAVGVAVGFSGAVGILFGLYPAHRAARLNPVEALGYE